MVSLPYMTITETSPALRAVLLFLKKKKKENKKGKKENLKNPQSFNNMEKNI